MSKITNDGLTRSGSGTGRFAAACTDYGNSGRQKVKYSSRLVSCTTLLGCYFRRGSWDHSCSNV